MRYVGKLGKTTVTNAKDLSIAVDPGLRPAFETPVEREPTVWSDGRVSVAVATANIQCEARLRDQTSPVGENL
jgi:hypothetical protein